MLIVMLCSFALLSYKAALWRWIGSFSIYFGPSRPWARPRAVGPDPGPRARGHGSRAAGLGLGPGLLAWARPRDHSPGQSKKHDSAMKMTQFLQKGCFSCAFWCFLGTGVVAIFKNDVFRVLFGTFFVTLSQLGEHLKTVFSQLD